MNFKKAATIAAAAGALAAISVPAMAFENEFHGMYRLRAMMTNFENANAGVVLAKDAPATTVFEQRARIQYIAKASDDLKLVTHFEIDSSWGDTAYNNGRGFGGAMGADTVNLETKNVYLDYNCPLTGANFKVGIQPQVDAYKGIFFNDDVAGVFASKKIAGVTGTVGFARLQDYNRTTSAPTTAGGIAFETANPTGKNTLDLFLLDGKFAVNKDLTVGGAYYLVKNNPVGVKYKDTLDVHTVGANAAAKFGMISADAFLAYQGGSELAVSGRDLSAFAAQAAVKANLDKLGTVRGNVLYASGGKATDSKAKAWQSLTSGDTLATSSNTYYDSKMVLLMRNVVNMDSDKALVQTINNGNRGVTLVTVGYDAAITDKLGASANIGYAMASQKQATDKSAALGTEINAQLDYKVYSNLTASLTGAYVILGDGKKYATSASTVKLDDPYLTSVMFNYAF
ncbi:MAG TPA: hypothetical protein VN642_10435 [Dongiaceae bacterium]|nr:hypothetical protein [Dongiaceae bacterium]